VHCVFLVHDSLGSSCWHGSNYQTLRSTP
jgi:hypothetical protein